MLNDDKITSLKENKSYKFNNSKSLSLGHKILTGLMAVSMLFSFVGCGKKENTPEIPVNPNPPIIEPVDPVDPVNPNPPVVEPDPDKPNPPVVEPDPDKPNPPVVDPDPEKPTKFVLNEENYKKLDDILNPHVLKFNQALFGSEAVIIKTEKIYLASSVENGKIDTIGTIVIEGKDGFERLAWSEFTIPVEESLSYENILANGLNWRRRDLKLKSIYDFSINKENETKYPTACDSLYTKAFGPNYKDSAWYGWKISAGPGWDAHKVVIYRNDLISEIIYEISNNGSTIGYEDSIRLYFKDKQESDKTYQTTSSKTYNIREGQNKKFFEIEKADAEIEK